MNSEKLVDHLRKLGKQGYGIPSQAMFEAADKIEELEAELEEAYRLEPEAMS